MYLFPKTNKILLLVSDSQEFFPFIFLTLTSQSIFETTVPCLCIVFVLGI